MTTVASRIVRSSPHRDAAATWAAIIDLLTLSKQTESRKELEKATGLAASCIADQVPKNSPIIVTCDGPRTRIYCLYDDEALDGTDANEDVFGYDPLNGEWAMSLPFGKDDLLWVQTSLKKLSSRITARDLNEGMSDENKNLVSSSPLTIDEKGFYGR